MTDNKTRAIKIPKASNQTSGCVSEVSMPKGTIVTTYAEKRIVELEQENEQLKTQIYELEHIGCGIGTYGERFVQKLYKEIDQLKTQIKEKDKQIEGLICNKQVVEEARNVLDVEQRNYTKELKVQIEELKRQNESKEQMYLDIAKEKAELKEQIEKLLDFVVERTVCCDVCPSSDTCRNDEGTCPHAGLLKENEEKVTREWILKSITKE